MCFAAVRAGPLAQAEDDEFGRLDRGDAHLDDELTLVTEGGWIQFFVTFDIERLRRRVAEERPIAPDRQEEAVDVAADAGADGPQYYEKAEINYTINTLIMFICAVLVLFMQAGFAMVEVGFNASKNAVNILFKNLMDLSIGVMLFMLVGYGLMYPGDDAAGKWFGFGGIWGERDSTETVAGLGDYSAAADFLFQVAFAATAATIVSGAVAGRMKFIGYLAYSAI
ncbi:MAG: ammonium transporter, partial [Anaerolineales bacterium]|nr:ammonium transporter [Anaerolineales bacterium]